MEQTLIKTHRERDLIIHALTGGSNPPRVYRNYFATDLDTPDGQVCVELARRGAMYRVAGCEGITSLAIFRVTSKGAKAVGIELKTDSQGE